MHKINLDNKNIYTDLIYEKEINTTNTKIIDKSNNLKVIENSNCTTIFYDDITDIDNYKLVQETFIKELKKYLKLKEKDKILVVGLGNNNSTPDSLGPSVINNILVTRHLYLLGDVEEGFHNVASFSPNVMANTGIESSRIIKNIINEIKPDKVLIIDALKTNNIERLIKTIQITNRGITPGSGINNNREEINKKNMKTEIIAIGIPTVVDIKNILKVKDNFIVTPTNIDFLIEKTSILIANSINKVLHKNFIRQNNN